MKPVNLPEFLERIERRYILKALASTGGVKERAAQLLGLNRTTLCMKIKVLGIPSAPRKFKEVLEAKGPDSPGTLKNFIVQKMAESLRENGGNKTKTAHALDISLRSLRSYVGNEPLLSEWRVEAAYNHPAYAFYSSLVKQERKKK